MMHPVRKNSCTGGWLRALWGSPQGRQKKLWDNSFLSPSRWQAQSNFETVPFLLNNQCNHIWARFHVHAQVQNGQSAAQGSMCVHSSTPCEELQNACQEGQLDKALDVLVSMEQEGIVPSVNLCRSLLKLCTAKRALAQAKRVCSYLLKQGVLTVGEYVVTTLVKCGSLEDALQVFHRLRDRTVFSWTAVISGYAKSGQGQEALRLYQSMLEDGVQPNTYTFVSLLKACGSIPDLQAGQRIHAEVLKYDCQNAFVGNCLVDMYGKCGSVVNAKNAFDQLCDQGVVSWNAMLSAYAQQAQAEMAWQLYEQMQETGVSPNDRTFVTVLQVLGMLAVKGEDVVNGGSTNARLLEKGKALHANMSRRGYSPDVFVASSLISMYGKCGSSLDARIVFDRLLERNLVSRNAMLAAYVEQSQEEQVLQLYRQMQQEGASPDGWTFVSALQACSMLAEKEENVMVCGQSIKISALQEGKVMHAHVQRKGYDSDVFVNNTLVSMYGKCGSNMDRQNVFHELSQRDNVSWNAMLAACIVQGQADNVFQLYSQMLDEGRSPDAWTFVSALQACSILAEKEQDAVLDGESTKVESFGKGRALHAALEKKGYNSDVFVGNALVTMYGKCGRTPDAQHVFGRLSQRDVVTWNAMLAAFAQQDQADKSLRLYEEMQEECISPNERTFASAFQACGMLAQQDLTMDGQHMKVAALQKGKAIHAAACKKSYDSVVFVGSSLISMYGMCGSLADARNVFSELTQLNSISWNALLVQYSQAGQAEGSFSLYKQMQEEGVSPDAWTFVGSLSACGILAEQEEPLVVANGLPNKWQSLTKVKAIHSEVWRRCSSLDVFVSSTLLSTYGKCGSILDAKNVFDDMPEQDVVAWTSMLASYVEQGQADKALELYEQMREEGTTPDDRTFVSILLACGAAAEKEEDHVAHEQYTKSRFLGKGKAIHAEAQMKGYDADLFVGNTLIGMYAKCGDVVDAFNVFQWMPERNVVSWTAMLVAYVEHGQAEEALQLYRKMQQEGPSHNEITLVCVVQACTKTGSLVFLRQIHHSLSSSRLTLSPVMAGALINAYAKCATMVDAQSMFDALPQPDVVSWTALIAGYAREGDTAAALTCYEKMQLAGVTPNRVAFLSILSACSHAGLVDRGVEYFESMSTKFGLMPQIEHYVSMVDLLGRAGCFQRLQDLMSTMPMEPSLAMWLCLLSACRKHGMVSLGEHAFRCATRMQPQHPAAYVLMSNIYADAGHLVHACNVKLLRLEEGAWKKPGQSWIEHEEKSHTFLVEDCNHTQHKEMYDLLRKIEA